jgi:NAD(P)-dependent dehydrogenase (short-subunit alcohol dehydrogenase family)
VIIEAGQVAVVTGAAQGLGRALAAGLLDRDVSVALADTAQEQLHDTAEEFATRGGQVLPVVTDVSDAVAVGALASRTLSHFGRVDVVVNNAGITAHNVRPLWQTDPEDWRRVLAVNLLGVVHGIQAFMPHLVTAGAGHVVNIASLAGLMAVPFGSAYCASKHAVVAVSETLRAELDMMGLPIGVTVVCPGYVRTPLTESMFTLLQAGDDAQLAELLPAGLSVEHREQVGGEARGGDGHHDGAGRRGRAHPRRGRSRPAVRVDAWRYRGRRPPQGRGHSGGTGLSRTHPPVNAFEGPSAAGCCPPRWPAVWRASSRRCSCRTGSS